jgi:hypothetical protein
MAVTAHDLLYQTENFERKEGSMITAGTLPMHSALSQTFECGNALRWLRKKDGTVVLQQAWVEVGGPGVEWRNVDVYEEPVGE